MPFQIGENVGPYRLIEKLGKGGMATVFKAYHARLDRYVAIKALHPAFMENEGFLDRFQQEARVVARLEHPHIVPIYDFSEHEERPYLVLKYVKGETLKAHLQKEKLSFPEIKRIFEAVSAAVIYAHQRGVLHRDIKPSNVLIEDSGQIFLADFGLARIAETSQTTMSAQMMMGTPHYISPEQAQGSADLDEGTDIYSLGVMMYELLVGEVPFQADTPFSVIHDHIYSPLPMPRDINPRLTEQLQKVLLKALAKKREDRYPDLKTMAAHFRAALDHQIQETGPRNTRSFAPVMERSALTDQSSLGEEAHQPTVKLDREEASQQVETGPKKRGLQIPGMVWWFGVPALVLLCLATVVVSNAASAPGPDLITPPTLTQEAASPIAPSRSPEIASLEERIQEDPSNPFLLVELGVELWESGKRQEAENYFREAYQLAEREPEVYLKMGDLLADIDLWTYSAVSYLQLKRHGLGISQEVYDQKLRRSVYYAGYEEHALPVFTRSEVDLEQDLLRLVEARRMIETGRNQLAETMITRTYQSRPELHESRLLLADLYLNQGSPAAAEDQLNQLLAVPELPEWLRAEADRALHDMMNTS
jgi:serine/threonine protein kinase